MTGKPYSRKLNVWFDEGELEIGLRSLRQFSTLPPDPTLFFDLFEYLRRFIYPFRPGDMDFRYVFVLSLEFCRPRRLAGASILDYFRRSHPDADRFFHNRKIILNKLNKKTPAYVNFINT